MEPYTVRQNKSFLGRGNEIKKLEGIAAQGNASIVIVYGRRRVGKTELLEQVYRQRNILKFEGLEGLEQVDQRKSVMRQLSAYVSQPLLKEVVIDTWTEVFQYIYRYVKKGMWTLYFEELQWLADYKDQFVSELKYMWDNYFRHNPQLIVILCGSSPSFMVNHVVHSKSLYNRSQYEIHLKEFNLIEAKQMLKNRSNREVMDAYLTLGGIPEYLKRLQTDSSVLLSLCKQSFSPKEFFTGEYEKIFISALASNKNYKQIIEFLSKKRFLNRGEIAKHIKQTPGGRISELLNDLVLCEFITKYSPYNLADGSKLARYCISDAYLQFYFKFIYPKKIQINEGVYQKNPLQGLKRASYDKWLGFAFERFCRKYHFVISRILGFSAVHYRSGAFYNRKTIESDSGYQIDLLFDRDDGVISICEIKHLTSKVSNKVISDFNDKLALFPNEKSKTIHRVLITLDEAIDNVKLRDYFDSIVTMRDLFDERYW